MDMKDQMNKGFNQSTKLEVDFDDGTVAVWLAGYILDLLVSYVQEK